MSYGNYLVQRFLYALGTLVVLSITIFLVIQLPAGDAVDRAKAARQAEGDIMTPEEEHALRVQYGLDKPLLVRYLLWIGGILKGDLGISYYGRPVIELINERLPATLLVSSTSIILAFAIAIPIGIYSATHQYSLGDYFWTAVGFIGLATPNFLLGILLIFLAFKYLGLSIGGLFSPGMEEQPWGMAKVLDLLSHLWIPLLVIASAGSAGRIRVMRATLLDELGKQYVITARAKGVPERKLLFKYPVRLALIPMVASIGRLLPQLIAGQTVVAIVLNLPTLGPMLFIALRTEDVELGGSILMVQSLLAIVGTLLSDFLLVLVDPRIRFEKGA